MIKKIKFSKNIIILVVIVISISMLNSIYSYQNYQSEKNKSGNISISRNMVNAINDLLSAGGQNYQEITKNLLSSIYYIDFLVFNSSMEPLAAKYNNANFNYSEEYRYDLETLIDLSHLDYQTIVDIALYVNELSMQQQEIVATFNYDAIKEDGTIIVDKVSYLSINDVVFVDIDYNDLISKKVTSLSTPFGEYSSMRQGDFIFDSYNFKVYDYMQENLKDAVINDKFDNRGYYEIIKPNKNLFGDGKDENDDTLKYYLKVCFQEINYKYGNYYQKNEYLEKLYGNYTPESGYFVWCEPVFENELYSFTDYLIDHYYNYIISLVLIIISYLITIKITGYQKKPVIIEKLVKKEPVIKRQVENKEMVDLEKILTQLVNNSQNLLIFRHLRLDYINDPLVILGNKNELTQMINEIYFYLIRNSKPNDDLTIKIDHNKIIFINNNNAIFNYNLDKLDNALEIIIAHDFQYDISNSFQMTINFDNS